MSVIITDSAVPQNLVTELIFSLQLSTKSIRTATELLLNSYRLYTLQASVAVIRKQLFAETQLYGQYIHPDTLSLVKGAMQIIETYRITTPLRFNTALEAILPQCGERVHQARKLGVLYTKIQENLENLKEQIISPKDDGDHRAKHGGEQGRVSRANNPPGRRNTYTQFGEKRQQASAYNTSWQENDDNFSPSGDPRPDLFQGILAGLQNAAHNGFEWAKNFVLQDSSSMAKDVSKVSCHDMEDKFIVASCVESLQTAIRALHELVDIISLVMAGIGVELERLRDGRTLSPEPLYTELVVKGSLLVGECKKLYLSKTDQEITLLTIDDEVDPEFKKNWCAALKKF